MNEVLHFILLLMLAASVMLHFCAAFFSWRLMRLSRRTLSWVMISAALVLMAVRRAVFFYHFMSGSAGAPLDFATESFEFFIPLLLVAGLLAIAPLVRRMYSVADSVEGSRIKEGAPDEIFEKATSGMAVFKAMDKGLDFIVRDINPAAEKIERTARQYVVGGRLTEVFPGLAGAGLLDMLQRVWKTGHPESSLLCCTDEGGSGWRDFFVYRRPGRDVVAVYSDVSDRVRLQDARDQSERECRLLFEQTPLPCQQMDPDGKILDVNPAWCLLTGIKSASAVGSLFSGMLPRTARQGFQKLLDGLKKGEEAAVTELDLPRNGDGLLTMEMHLLPLRDAAEKTVKVYGLLRKKSVSGPALDDADAGGKARSEALEQLAGERRELQRRRLSLLDELTGGVAHELNTPLTAARNAFNLIRQGVSPSSPHYEFAGIASRELTRMANMIEQMCRFHDPVTCESERLNINALLDNALTLVRGSMQERRIRLRDERSESVPSVILPPAAVMSVLVNPVRNSIEAMAADGILTLRTGPADAGGVFIEIEDNGPGIPKEFLPHLFEPFTTLHNRSEQSGIGLGMAIVRHVLDVLGGSVDVQSDEGSGTCIRIILPARSSHDD